VRSSLSILGKVATLLAAALVALLAAAGAALIAACCAARSEGKRGAALRGVGCDSNVEAHSGQGREHVGNTQQFPALC